MKITLDQPLLDTAGNELPKDQNGKQQNLGEALKHAALFDEQNANQDTKHEGFGIFIKILNAENAVELTTEEISTLKKKAAKMLATLLYGQIAAMLEGNENPIANAIPESH